MKKCYFFDFPRASPANLPLAKEATDAGYENDHQQESFSGQLQSRTLSPKALFPRVSPGDQPLAKELEHSGYEIGTILTRKITWTTQSAV